jgi:hypothetical protein
MFIFYCLRFESLPTWRVRSPYLYPPGTEWPSYSPRHWVSFSSPPTTRRVTVEVFEPAYTREELSSHSRILSVWTTHIACASVGVPTWSLLANWLLPSNIKHSSYCCMRVFRAWPRDGRPSIVACTSVAGYLASCCPTMLWANPSQYSVSSIVVFL